MRIQLKPGIVATVLANADPGKLLSRSQSAIMKNSPQLDSREPHANTGFPSEKGISEIGSLFHCFSVVLVAVEGVDTIMELQKKSMMY